MTVRRLRIVVGAAASLGFLPGAALAQFGGGGGGQGTTSSGVAPAEGSTATSVMGTNTQAAAPGAVPGGVQPPATGNATQTPATIQLGPVQGLGGGIRPPRLTPIPGEPLTLDQAIRISLANNLNIFTAQAQDIKAVKRVDETRTGYLPRLGASANYTYTGQVATATFPTGAGMPPASIALGTHNQYTANASVTQPIDTSGSIGATVGIARAQQAAQNWALDSSRRQVILTTSTAFLQVLRAASQYDVVQQEFADAQAHVTLAQQMLRAGTIAPFDLLTTQTNLENVRQQLFAALNARNEAVAGLDNAMGVGQDITFRIEVPPAPTGTVPDFATSLATALRNRPELKQIEANIQTSRQSVRLAQSGTKPSIGLQANYNYTGLTSGFATLHQNWTLGVVGSWDPFDWGATQDRASQAREDQQTAEYQREQTAQGIEYQVRQALNQIADALQRRTAAATAVTQAQEQIRLANVRFRAGVGTNTEVRDAEAALAQAQSSSANALYDYYTAQANYERATGTEPSLLVPTTPSPAALPPAAPPVVPRTVPPAAAPRAAAPAARSHALAGAPQIQRMRVVEREMISPADIPSEVGFRPGR